MTILQGVLDKFYLFDLIPPPFSCEERGAGGGQKKPMPKKIEVKNLDLFYGDFQALKSVDMTIEGNNIVGLIGPSGCGKSTLLRTINRMNDLIEGVKIHGEVLLDGVDIYGSQLEIYELRKRVGMVFQRPNPFPLSVHENVSLTERNIFMN